MARAEQIKALFRAYAGNEDAQFISVALQVAADEARRGHDKLAAELRELIDKARAPAAPRARARTLPLVQPRGELAELLIAQYPQHPLKHMVLSKEVEQKLQRVLLEQRQHERLSGHGLSARRKLLLVGPPGTGKTMTAAVLATELKLPLFTARFDSLITKFMGESASKLRLVFDALKTTRGVYFFDEFDSLGMQRGAQHDVAEMRRTLNMFLQLIEQDTSDSIIVAATNHGASLDFALFRRFDDVIRYTAPDEVQIDALLRNRLALMAPNDLNWSKLIPYATGLSHSEITRACEDAIKDAILGDQENITEKSVRIHLQERTASQLNI
ncbi:AAA family ATPase [Comamonas sp.]|uniref:AAA family ATPase n=1 Tax=Comamonas sp. TaxID=34028 RepID=UPI0012BF1267|nr:ATP-binding protein [Comamonas sp.]MPT11986.1 ATP-binding protein [Comamonas sp.]